MVPAEEQNLTVQTQKPACSSLSYTWKITAGGGSAINFGEIGGDAIYGPEEAEYDPDAVLYNNHIVFTAPATNPLCANDPTIEMWCGGELMDAIDISVDSCAGNVSIGYTSQQMATNGQQTIIAQELNPPCVPTTYTWEIIAGGGTITPSTGASITYTAPATNAECANNPTIQLACNDVVVGTLQLAINAGGAEPAYGVSDFVPNDPQSGYCDDLLRVRTYRCNGTANQSTTSCDCIQQGAPDGCRCGWGGCGYQVCSHAVQIAGCQAGQCGAVFPGAPENCPTGTHDNRSQQQITDGCCPAALL